VPDPGYDETRTSSYDKSLHDKAWRQLRRNN
jgi:hypothetical protein